MRGLCHVHVFYLVLHDPSVKTQTAFLIILIVEALSCNDGYGILVVGSWLWNIGCGILSFESCTWNLPWDVSWNPDVSWNLPWQ